MNEGSTNPTNKPKVLANFVKKNTKIETYFQINFLLCFSAFMKRKWEDFSDLLSYN